MRFSVKSLRSGLVLLPVLALTACGGPSTGDIQTALDKSVKQELDQANHLSMELIGRPNPLVSQTPQDKVVDSDCHTKEGDDSIYTCRITLKNAQGDVREATLPVKKVEGEWVILKN
ncbi:hypothetical protein CFR75_08985 [Komagataeibacter xylinus]|uniref:Uncharacterized protein n=1 Tax=Komagataeibacter xylinus TaxID=28448 RepID=A0A318PHZ1_KOMXY|nr:hypothetical protein [Komagataeibacter xylinus]AZV38248.1 hypothetical protein CXP35_04880 [Komagataeibacter xylinus]PYD56781.1 hypothetical protein CFR75_08985 [Komagataeibacter xylinus]GBQ66973.1 hypothetical protein AA15237_0053 [Komagataeibacter xylinus NBRC 15237]